MKIIENIMDIRMYIGLYEKGKVREYKAIITKSSKYIDNNII